MGCWDCMIEEIGNRKYKGWLVRYTVRYTVVDGLRGTRYEVRVGLRGDI
jgi:hypothetical protein